MVGLLIRHGHAEPVGRWLAGRREGVALSDIGRAEAERLRDGLAYAPLTAIYSSPMQRAVETAEPLARDHGLCVQPRAAFNEVDFGDWTGRMLEDLAEDAAWRSFNANRQCACPPGGEALQCVQRRVVDELLALSRCHAGEMIAIVTHAEPIRCAIAAFCGGSLDDVLTLEISPGHVSTIGIEPMVCRVLAVNLRADQAI